MINLFKKKNKTTYGLDIELEKPIIQPKTEEATESDIMTQVQIVESDKAMPAMTSYISGFGTPMYMGSMTMGSNFSIPIVQSALNNDYVDKSKYDELLTRYYDVSSDYSDIKGKIRELKTQLNDIQNTEMMKYGLINVEPAEYPKLKKALTNVGEDFNNYIQIPNEIAALLLGKEITEMPEGLYFIKKLKPLYVHNGDICMEGENETRGTN